MDFYNLFKSYNAESQVHPRPMLALRTHAVTHRQASLQVQRSLHLLGTCQLIQQNYNQLYHAYNEKIVEIQKLAQENDMLKRERTVVKVNSPAPEESFFKERFLFMEKSCEELKNEVHMPLNTA